MRPPSIQLGGPSYCMQVDARHAVTMASLATVLSSQRIELLEFGYKHGTPVDCPRNELFRDALRDKIDVLVWLDSDCYLLPQDVQAAAELVMATYKNDWAFTTAATPQRDGIVNVWSGKDVTAKLAMHKYSIEDIEEFKRTGRGVANSRFPILASGLGFAVFGMRKFRKGWNQAPWFCSRHALLPDGTPYFQSEDFTFTSRIPQELPGELPHCDPRFIVQHAHRGGA